MLPILVRLFVSMLVIEMSRVFILGILSKNLLSLAHAVNCL